MTSTMIAPLNGSLDRLPGIGLAELVEAGSLLTRIDRKYVVPRRSLESLLAGMPAETTALELSGRRSFGYRSVYLDTPELTTYLSAGRGHRRRYKVRTRAYLDTGTCWLEVKTRGPRGVTVKQRIEHPDAEFVGLTPQGRDFVAARLSEERISGCDPSELRTALVTSYSRSTLFLPSSQSRVTIDTELGWTGLGSQRGDVDVPHIAVIETKTGSTPSEVDRLLWSRGHRPVRLSKYGVGVASLRDDLPDLKWSRTLRRVLPSDGRIAR